MAQRIITSHISEESNRRGLLLSLLGHGLLFGFFLFAADFLPAGEPILLGSGEGGGQGGDFVRVGLAADLGGGEGMYKPAVTPRPAAAPPPPERPATPPPEPEKENVFVEKAEPTPRRPVERPVQRAAASSKTPPPPAPTGAIPREPDPGSGGPGGASTGAGGGFGGGQGVRIGAGTGEGAIDSWYVRQVEQRIGQNWLKTTLGQLSRSVRTVISFEILPDGQIANIRIEQSSGIRTVDLAAQRAVQASHPLPRVPLEFRNRRIKFIANFEYPPRP